MRRNRITLLLLLLGILPVAAVLAADAPVHVGFVVDGPWVGNDWVRGQTVAEILALTEGEFEVVFPPSAYREGDWTPQTARSHLEQLLDDPEVDIIVTWGTLASHTACCFDELDKPVVAPVVVDRELQGFPLRGDASGVPNLSYVLLPSGLTRDLAYFRQMVSFHRVAILLHGALLDEIPQLPERTREQLGDLDVAFDYIPVRDSVEEVLASLPDEIDAVYVWPLFHLSEYDLRRLVEALNGRRLPTFSAFGGTDLDQGMLASLGSDDFLPRLARRVALNVQRILLGEEPGTIPVEFLMRERLRINMETARRIGVSPSWRLLLEAEALNPQPEAEIEARSLRGAVTEAVRLNLDLLVRQRAVEAGAQEVERSRSLFLPQIDINALGLRIDDDRAAASLGSRSEQSLSASATLSQLLFSDEALANANVQSRLQEGREADLQSVRLDIALEAGTAYLNLLRAKSLVQVRRNNLELTRSNLELAQIRRAVGAASPAEVFRWESQIATERKGLVEALGNQQITEIALNRIMHRPLDERFLTEEVGLTDPGLVTGQDRFSGYTETPRRYETLTEFLVQKGFSQSPELAELDAVIDAQQRLVVSTKRAYWAPTLGLEATWEEILARSGAGTDPPQGFDLFPFPFPVADDTNWSVGVSARLPLFRGGARAADRLQAEIELERLALARTSVAERIEQRVRSAMVSAWSSFFGIELSAEAAAAARKNLDLVSDAYARGAVPIIDLLDAQNAALNAEQQATNAIYDFLVDLMEAERATSHFHLLMSREESRVCFDEIDAFFDSRGIEADIENRSMLRYDQRGERHD